MTDGEATPFRPSRSEVAPYRILDTRRRRSAAIVYFAMAVVTLVLAVVAGVNGLVWTAVVPLVGIAVYHVVTGWKMTVADMKAIELAAEAVTFEVGHGSATLGFRGILAKPIWQVLVFSATPSPDHQALVTVDALDGSITGRYEEQVAIP